MRFHSRLRMLHAGFLILSFTLASCQGGGPSGPAAVTQISFSTTSLDFSGTDSERQVSIRNLSSAPIDWWVQGATVSWVSATPPNGVVSAGESKSFTVRVDRAALQEGFHSATMTIGAPAHSQSISISVQQGPPARAVIEPTSMAIGLQEADHTIEIINQGGSSLEWVLTGPSWATVSPSSGTLTAGARRQVVVTPNRDALSDGTHTNTLSLVSNGGNLTVPLSVEVGPTAKIRLDPATLDLGPSGTQHQFRVMNDGNASLHWTAQPTAPWISVSPSSASIPPGLGMQVSVTVTRGGLSHGSNQALILFSSNGGAAHSTVLAFVAPAGHPNPGVGQPQLDISPNTLDFGQTATELQLMIHNLGDLALDWSGHSQSEWVSLPTSAGRVSPRSSTPIMVKVSRASLLTPGAYQAVLQITSNGGTATASVNARVSNQTSTPPAPSPPPPSPPPTPEPTPAKLVVSPTSISFGETGTELTVKITNSGGLALDWSAQPSKAWLSLPISSGQVAAGAAQNVTIRASRSGLSAAGQYQSSVQFSSNGGSQAVPVSLTVPALPLPPPGSSGTVSVVDFGARGNDQLDDATAFAAAIAALPAEGGTVRIPAGTYLFTAPSRSSIRRSIDLFRRSNVTLAGDGMNQTVLRMAPGQTYSGDTHFISIERSTGIKIQDLTVDGNRTSVTYLDEQSHGIEVDGSSNVRIERVLLTGMHGDGVRLLGLLDPVKWVEQIWIEDCAFSYNGRSGIAVQRLVQGVTIRGNTFTRIQDQAIDFEPSGATLTDIAPRDFVITHNRFFNTATLALTITGLSKEDRARGILVADNEFEDTGIFVFNAQDTRIERNLIRAGYSWAPIEIRKASERIWIVENDIDARASDKPAIVLTYHTSAAPTTVYVIDNTIRTAGSAGISARDSEILQVTGNRLFGEGSAGINVLDIVSGTPLTSFRVENNELVGYQTGIRFASGGDPMTGVCVRSNSFASVAVTFATEGPVQLACN